MPQANDRRVLLRWIFLVSGWILLLGDNFVVQYVLRLESAPRGTHRPDPLVALAHLCLLVSSLLCLATARAFRRSRKWARWTGISACLILLPWFPWLTLVAAVGLYTLIARFPRLDRPAPPKQTTDYWTRKRKSWVQQVFIYVGYFAAMGPGMAWVQRYAHLMWMPTWHPNGRILYLIVFGLFITAVHELGHAIVAWALYHRVRVINIGPFTFSNFGHGYQFHFQWQRLLNGGGHVAAIPSDGRHLRLKLIAVIAAGPAASLLNALLMFAIFLSLPGTSWQSYWWIPGFIGVLAITDGVLNLVPAGYSDGSMLFHTILWTRHGQALINHLQAAQLNEDADVCHKQADFEKEVELREAAFTRAREGGDGSAVAIALCHQSLGHARLALEDWPAAEVEHRACLAFEAECALNPPLAANSWLGLQRACLERHHLAEAARAYAGAAQVIEGRKKNRDKIGLAVTRAMLAQVHHRGGSYDKALEEIAEALRTLPGGRDRLMLRAILYSTQAQCELGLGSVERGMAAARQAIDILRSGKLPPDESNLGWDELGELGEELWRVGQDALALELLREAIQQLESGGATATAAQYRTKLSAGLRHLGKVDEAGQWLPKEDGLSTVPRRQFLAERARLQLAAGHAELAVADGRALLALWQAAPHDPVTETAIAEALLAEAYLEAGDYAQADSLARKASDVLGPLQHYEIAGCLITLALARWRATGAWMPACMDQARRLIQADPILSPAAKTRIIETQATRVEQHGPTKEVPAAVAVAAYS
ncbi:MAG TPA: M50 family metallopeptidase [Bryobacteraceae bacterium]|jgi:tetratricopeptide (TPR) repeat protein|nr:M50 family metallopeptidase [Bryobacteraceae bacterium]